jgi:hypothetical protein
MTARHISQSTTTHSPQDSVAEELASWREQFKEELTFILVNEIRRTKKFGLSR